MKLLLLLVNIILIASVSFAQGEKQITIANPGDFERRDELIVLQRSVLEKNWVSLTSLYRLL